MNYYHFQIVNDRLLTQFLAQTVLFSTLDVTERTLGTGTLRLRGRVDFEGSTPSLNIGDIFVSDSGLAQQVSADAVVYLGFVLGAGFQNLHVKSISYTLETVESKKQLRIAQAWASPSSLHPGDTVQITALLQGENGFELTRTASYRLPVGAPIGPLDLSIADAVSMNSLDFAGLAQSSLHSPQELIKVVNAYRGSDAVYFRVWRQEPSFSVAGTLPGGELTDPPPSAMLVLADNASSATSNAAQTFARGSQIAEIVSPVNNYVVTGAKTIQVEVKE